MGMKHFAWAALALVIGAVAMTPNTAQSAVIITFEETGGDVTMTLTGSLNVSALGTPSLTTVGNGVGPSIPNIAVGNVIDFYGSAGLTGPALDRGGPLVRVRHPVIAFSLTSLLTLSASPVAMSVARHCHRH